MSQHRISVIIATYNCSETLQRSIDSVVGQDYPNKEIVIIDGASTDGTVEIIRANEQLIDYWESEPDRGVYHAWNKALDHATGDWIHFLGADDYLSTPQVLSKVSRRVRECEGEVLLVYGQLALVSTTGKLLQMAGQPWELSKRNVQMGMPIPHPAVFHHRSLFNSYGGFDESFRIAGDYEFLLRILKKSTPHFLYDVVVTEMTVGGISSSPDYKLTMLREDARARKMNGLPKHSLKSFWVLFRAAIRSLFKRTMGERTAQSLEALYCKLTGAPPALYRQG